MTMTAAMKVSGLGHSTNMAIAPVTTAHACSTRTAPATLDLRRRCVISADVRISAAFTMVLMISRIEEIA
jgi:hypothetical protein